MTAEHLHAVLADGVVADGPMTVSAARPEAASVGLQILAEGGNAFDAAVAAALVETVTLPMKCGLAGDLVALIREPTGGLIAIQSIGPGAAALDHGAKLARTGAASVGVPGAPHGYAILAERCALPLARLAAPAIAIAREGHRWSKIAAALTAESVDLLRRENGPLPYLPQGRAPKQGEPMRLPGLGKLLEAFIVQREELFFGEIGEAVIARVRQAGGFLAIEDLRCRPGIVLAPDVTELAGGYRLLTTPGPTRGPALAHLVRRLESRWGEPTAVLDAFLGCQAGGRGQDGTSLVTASDTEGNVVTLMQSNSFQHYGSGIVIEPWHIVLNNRPGRGFSVGAPPSHPNAPRAGRVPRTTLHLWALEAGTELWLGGTPGGANQLPWNLQAVCRLLSGERRLEKVVTGPLWGLDGSGGLALEADHALAGQARGPAADATIVPPLSVRSVQQIVHLHARSIRRSVAADPRTGGRALGLPAASWSRDERGWQVRT
jgi:gamma-glutamyltranspeptidase / glutathione hydrolase